MIARKARRRFAAFTIVELVAGMAVFGILMTGLLRVWASLSFTGMNTTTYAARQNDQMRILDYVKRDIRRAKTIEIYNGGTLVTGTTTFGTELRITVPDYYSDSREEDNAIGTKATTTPSVASGNVNYGTALTIRYYTSGGAAIRSEGGIVRTVGSATGAFALSFKRETTGAIRCRVFFDQPLRGGSVRTLRRQVDCLCVPRFEYQL